MANRTAFLVTALICSIATARGDDPKSAQAGGRIVEGTVVSAGKEPVAGAADPLRRV